MIMPGLMLSMKSLASGTSQLPKISLEPPKRFIGTNTVDCMKSGLLYSAAYGMDGIIDGIENELGEKVNAVATGGLAKVIVPLCKKEIAIDDELLLKGLMEIYNRNK
jgi:type III pantothenate kinase